MNSSRLIEEVQLMLSKNSEFCCKMATVVSQIDDLPPQISDRIKLSSILCKVNNNRAVVTMKQKLKTSSGQCFGN